MAQALPSFNTTAWEAVMCFYLCLIPLLSFPQWILCCCKILLFIMALFPPLRDLTPLPPSLRKPRVACYMALGFCRKYSLLPTFISLTDDVMFLDSFTPEGFFDLSTPRFRIENVYFCSLTHISKKTALRPLASCSPRPPEVQGAYNVNSSSGCFRPGSFRPSTTFFCPDPLGAPGGVCLATIPPAQNPAPLQRQKHPFACLLPQKPFDPKFSAPRHAQRLPMIPPLPLILFRILPYPPISSLI